MPKDQAEVNTNIPESLTFGKAEGQLKRNRLEQRFEVIQNLFKKSKKFIVLESQQKILDGVMKDLEEEMNTLMAAADQNQPVKRELAEKMLRNVESSAMLLLLSIDVDSFDADDINELKAMFSNFCVLLTEPFKMDGFSVIPLFDGLAKGFGKFTEFVNANTRKESVETISALINEMESWAGLREQLYQKLQDAIPEYSCPEYVEKTNKIKAYAQAYRSSSNQFTYEEMQGLADVFPEYFDLYVDNSGVLFGTGSNEIDLTRLKSDFNNWKAEVELRAQESIEGDDRELAELFVERAWDRIALREPVDAEDKQAFFCKVDADGLRTNMHMAYALNLLYSRPGDYNNAYNANVKALFDRFAAAFGFENPFPAADPCLKVEQVLDGMAIGLDGKLLPGNGSEALFDALSKWAEEREKQLAFFEEKLQQYGLPEKFREYNTAKFKEVTERIKKAAGEKSLELVNSVVPIPHVNTEKLRKDYTAFAKMLREYREEIKHASDQTALDKIMQDLEKEMAAVDAAAQDSRQINQTQAQAMEQTIAAAFAFVYTHLEPSLYAVEEQKGTFDLMSAFYRDVTAPFSKMKKTEHAMELKCLQDLKKTDIRDVSRAASREAAAKIVDGLEAGLNELLWERTEQYDLLKQYIPEYQSPAVDEITNKITDARTHIFEAENPNAFTENLRKFSLLFPGRTEDSVKDAELDINNGKQTFRYDDLNREFKNWKDYFQSCINTKYHGAEKAIAGELLGRLDKAMGKWSRGNGTPFFHQADAANFLNLIKAVSAFDELNLRPETDFKGIGEERTLDRPNVFLNRMQDMITQAFGMKKEPELSYQAFIKMNTAVLNNFINAGNGSYNAAMFQAMQSLADEREKKQQILELTLLQENIHRELDHQSFTDQLRKIGAERSPEDVTNLLGTSAGPLRRSCEQYAQEQRRQRAEEARKRRVALYRDPSKNKRYVPDRDFQKDPASRMDPDEDFQLFPDKNPVPEDVIQHENGSCFMLSALRSMAQNDPDRIKNMIHDNGDGTVTVRFYQKDKNEKKIPLDVTVDKTLHGLDLYSAPWVKLMEKAYVCSGLKEGATLSGRILNTDPDHPTMSTIAYGDSLNFMEHVYPDEMESVNNERQMSGTDDFAKTAKMISDEIHKIMNAHGTATVNDYTHAMMLQGIEGDGLDAKIRYVNQFTHGTPTVDTITLGDLLMKNQKVVALQAAYMENGRMRKQQIPIANIARTITKNISPLTKKDYLYEIHRFYGHYLNDIYKKYGNDEAMHGFAEGNSRTNNMITGFKDTQTHDYLLENVLTNGIDFAQAGTYGEFMRHLQDPAYQNELIRKLHSNIAAMRKTQGNYNAAAINDLEYVLDFAQKKEPVGPAAQGTQQDDAAKRAAEEATKRAEEAAKRAEEEKKRAAEEEKAKRIAEEAARKKNEALEKAAGKILKEKTEFRDALHQDIIALQKYSLIIRENRHKLTYKRGFLEELEEMIQEARSACENLERNLKNNVFFRNLPVDCISKYQDAMIVLAENCKDYLKGSDKKELNETDRMMVDSVKTLQTLAKNGESLPQILKKQEKQADPENPALNYKQMIESLKTAIGENAGKNADPKQPADPKWFIKRKILQEANAVDGKQFDEAGYNQVDMRAINAAMTKALGMQYAGYIENQLLTDFGDVSFQEADEAYDFLKQFAEDLNDTKKLNHDGPLTLRQQEIYDRMRDAMPAEFDQFKDLRKQIINAEHQAKEQKKFSDRVKFGVFKYILNGLTLKPGALATKVEGSKKAEALENAAKTISALEAEYQKYAKLDYDRNYVYDTLEAYTQAHPDAAPAQLARRKRCLIAQEAIVASYAMIARREGQTPDQIRALTEKIRSKPNSYKEYDYFIECADENFLPFLRSYQEKAKKNDSVKAFDEECGKLYSELMPQLKSFENYGKAYHKGLLAGKTDPSGMVFNMDVPEESSLLYEWQKDIQSVELKPGEYLNHDEDLLEYAVMGKCLSEDGIELAKKNMPDLRKLNTSSARLVFFANTLDDGKNRLRDLWSRSIMGNVRRNVKNDIEENSQAAQNRLKEYLQTALEAMFENVRDLYQYDKPLVVYSVENMDRLLQKAEQAGIALHMTKEQRDIFKTMQERRKLIMRMTELTDRLREEGAKMVHGNMKDHAYDVRYNSRLYADILEVNTLRSILNRIAIEINNTVSSYQDKKAERLKDSPERNLTITEKMLLEDPEGLVAYYRNQVACSSNMQKISEAETPEQRLVILTKGGLPYNDDQQINYQDAYAFERAGAGWNIKSFLDSFDQTMQTFDQEIHKADHPEKGACKKVLSNMKSAVKKLKAARNHIKEPWTTENMDKLKPYYENVANAYDAYEDFLKANDNNHAYRHRFDSLVSFAEKIADQYEHIDVWKSCIKEGNRTADLLNHRKVRLNFEKFYGENLANLKKLAEKKTMGRGYQELLDDMEVLHRVLSGAGSGKKSFEGDAILGSEGYCQYVMNDIDQLLRGKTKGIDKDMKVFLTSMKAQLQSDMEHTWFLKSSTNFYEDFKNAQKDYCDEIAEYNNRELRDTIAKMTNVSTRVGGNSTEFADVLDQMNLVKNFMINEHTPNSLYLAAIEGLYTVTDTYIKAKDIVPGSDKGKARLNLAKNMRDLCGNLIISFSEKLENSMKFESVSKYEIYADRIRNEKKNTSLAIRNKVEEMKALANNPDVQEQRNDLRVGIAEDMASLIFWDNMEKSIFDYPLEDLRKLTSEDAEMPDIAQSKADIQNILEDVADEDLFNAAITNTAVIWMSRKLKAYQADAEKRPEVQAQNPNQNRQNQMVH